MENNLKNRYIYAVCRHLPAKMQGDVQKELDGLISEMMDERGSGNLNSEQTLKGVLDELGTPSELALKYHEGGQKSLISGVYFLMYKQVLRIVLPIIAAVLAVFTTASFLVGDGEALHIIIGTINLSFMAHFFQIIAVTAGGVVQAFAVITVVFAVIEYKKVNLKEFNLQDLPNIPEAKMKISPFWPIFSIALSISLTALLLGFPQIIGISINFNWTPALDVDFVRSLWLPIIFWTILEIIAEIGKLVEGHYTKRLAAITVITAILQVACVILIFGNNSILNPEFVSHLSGLYVHFQPINWIFDNVNLTIMTIALIAIFFETLEVVVKTFQAKNHIKS